MFYILGALDADHFKKSSEPDGTDTQGAQSQA